MFIELEHNKELVQDDFDLFGRLNVPVGEYEFDRVRAEIATGVQRPVRVVLSVQDGGFFGGERLENASLRTDVAFNSKWSWSNFFQYDNTGDVYGLNSRLRYVPEAGREMVLVFNHGGVVDPLNHLSSEQSDIILKFSYTFRY